jgi:two-component system, chemotaxis family, protein-glutamate methylesterase/glutaminase
MKLWTAAKNCTGEPAVSFDLFVIGSTSACTHLLPQLLNSLPPGFHLPIAAVQHRVLGDGGALARFLQQNTPLTVVEAEDKQPLQAGCIYLAPADYHLLIETGHCALSTEGPVRLARPSIDVLFESAADAYGCRLIGVLLADGNGNQDGMHGLAAIREQGGLTFAPTSAAQTDEVRENMLLLADGMDQLMPPAAIGSFLLQLLP